MALQRHGNDIIPMINQHHCVDLQKIHEMKKKIISNEYPSIKLLIFSFSTKKY